MRELERKHASTQSPRDLVALTYVTIVGRGRLGVALATGLREAGLAVTGPLGREPELTDPRAVLLCVPDGEIAGAAAKLGPGLIVGHCSGATGLDALGGHEAFSLHPLMTVTAAGARFEGAGAAIAGSTPQALSIAAQLARALGMNPVALAEDDRAAYHAAASIASNFLVTLEAAAERLAAGAGVPRELLVPLVRATVENWATLGAGRALTGPIARGDEQTVARQREAVAQRAGDLLPLFDALVQATRSLACPDGRATGSPGRNARTERTELDRADRPARPDRGHRRTRTLRTVAEVRAALDQLRRDGRSIGLVPTMGALHEGHLSLIRRARHECELVVVSLFVNPTQFNDRGDLHAYPRDERLDAQLAAEAGVDYLFAPPPHEVYPSRFATQVSVGVITETLEGRHRGRAHFDGVTTVVTKLLNIVAPQVAYFGQKDIQQAVVIRRLVRDLDIPVRIEVCPTVRAPDGLALSSRNVRLSAGERQRANALHRALALVSDTVLAGERDPAAAIAPALGELARAEIDLDYLELVDADTLAPVARIDGDVLVLIAGRVGSTRLIDNTLIHVLSTARLDGGGKPIQPEVMTCSARC
jgi:pantoate--beta-alanine ligase